MKTKRLSHNEALNTGVAAALVSGRMHVVYQLRNGAWKWARFGFFRVSYLAAIGRKFYMIGRDGGFTEVPSNGRKGN